jgi:hypothetical protein
MFRKMRVVFVLLAISLCQAAGSQSPMSLNPAGQPPAPGKGNERLVQADADQASAEPIIVTIAGPQLPYNGARATTQAIDYPRSVAVDAAGNFYLSSSAQNRVYKVAPDGTLTLFAGSSYGYGGDGGPATSAKLAEPKAIAFDKAGNLYIAEAGNHRIRKVTAAGVISTVAGNGETGHGGDEGPATSAELDWPHGVAVDSAGNLYIADSGNHCIRKVTAAGIISTVAGNGMEGFYGDGGAATSAMLAYPFGIALDTAGNLYIADSYNQRIRKVSAGIISTVAGDGTREYGGDGGPATSAQLRDPYGVDVDNAGNLYIADSSNHRIRKVTAAGIISTVAGSADGGYFGGDGGPAISAQLSGPFSVTVDAAGGFYIADTENHRVRRVTPAGIISTVAGGTISEFGGDGGAATLARLYKPTGLAADAIGDLFIADTINCRIRKVTVGGVISTVAGRGGYGFSGDGGPAISAQLRAPLGIAVDAIGNIYIADTENHRIRKVTTDGVIRTIAGNGIAGFGGDGGPAISAQLNHPETVAIDSAGNLYITDIDNQRIRKVTPAGVISTVAGNGTPGFSGDGGSATLAQLSCPHKIAVDSAGNIYIPEGCNHRIRKVTAGGIITTIAGNGSIGFSGDGGPATLAEIYNPFAVAVDAIGNLYIADTGNYRIRKVTPAGMINTIAGNGTDGFSGDGGPATSAQFGSIEGISVDAAGNVYISEANNHRVRLIKTGPVPGVATLLSPSGNITTSTPAYTWTAVPLAAMYLLYVNDSAAAPKIRKWYTAEQASCASGSGTCSVTPSEALAAGACQWWIQTRNGAGDGPWSSAMSFTVTSGPPGKATLISPSGAVSTATPTYTWNAVSGSAWYYLWVDDSKTQGKINQWYKAVDAGCGSGTGTCTATPSTTLAGGSCLWWIQTWSDAGFGPWSDAMSFEVRGSLPGKATLISPSGSISSSSPTYQWNAVSDATWYLLWVNDSKDQAKVNAWTRAADAGCGSGTGTCAVTPTVALAAGACQWWIQTWNDAGYGPWSDTMSFVVPGGNPPGKATLISPTGNIPSTSPIYSWEAVPAATWYLLRVADSASQTRISQWYKAADARCGSGTGTCNARPSTSLADGAYQWWIQTWNDAGDGPWSDAMSFTILGSAAGLREQLKVKP